MMANGMTAPLTGQARLNQLLNRLNQFASMLNQSLKEQKKPVFSDDWTRQLNHFKINLTPRHLKKGPRDCRIGLAGG